MSGSAFELLRQHLARVGRGAVGDPRGLEGALAACWDELDGGDEAGMMAYKLHGRMEDVTWEPPLLSFTIERHGATVQGSTRAELQHWSIDIENRTANCSPGKPRQIRPMQARLDALPIAAEIAELIVSGGRDNRVKWLGRDRVRVLVGNVLPSTSAVRQTLAARRRRLRKALQQEMAHRGWKEITLHTYVRSRTDTN